MSEALEEFLFKSRECVDADLRRVLQTADAPPSKLHCAMRYAVFPGGKRLRPVLTYAAARVGSAGDGWEVATPLASAVELAHCFSLVHDDLPALDDAEERRGLPSVHVAFGEATALLAGDALLCAAFAQLGRVWSAQEAVRRFGAALGARGMIGGECEDCAFEAAGAEETAVVSIHTLKTAALFRFAVWGGGASAGADAPALAALDAFALHYGVAFQLVDDLLDGATEQCSILHALSIEQAQLRARDRIERSQESLAALGSSADILREMAARLARQLPSETP